LKNAAFKRKLQKGENTIMDGGQQNQGNSNFRQHFTNFLDNHQKFPTNNKKVNGITFFAVSSMNTQMVANNVPMTREHYETATKSISNGDKICTFLQKENGHVLESSGSGVAYNLGKTAHKIIKAANEPVSPQIEEMLKTGNFGE
jgi:hypothetical protein